MEIPRVRKAVEKKDKLYIRTFLVRYPSSFLPPWLSALGWFLTQENRDDLMQRYVKIEKIDVPRK